MSEESGAALLLVVVVIPALILNVLVALAAPRSSAAGAGHTTSAAGEEPLTESVPYLLCRILGHRRREEAPGIYFCPRCGGALAGRSSRQG
jgi:hypothetical protein